MMYNITHILQIMDDPKVIVVLLHFWVLQKTTKILAFYYYFYYFYLVLVYFLIARAFQWFYLCLDENKKLLKYVNSRIVEKLKLLLQRNKRICMLRV